MGTRTLRSTVLRGYTYDDLKELCFAPDSTFGNIFDCQWDVWRDKAVADFDISPQFFDLITTLSGPQRYLQIASYVKLSPLSGVRVYENTGMIEGVYEAYAGMNKAKDRKDVEMMLWFYQRLAREQKEALFRIERSSGLEKLREIELLGERWQKKKGEKEEYLSKYWRGGSKYLNKVIKANRIDLLDKVIHKYFTLPEGFSIQLDIPKVPFWKISSWQPMNLPLQPDVNNEEVEEIINSSLQSADTRIVDFFRSIFRDRNLQKFTKYTSTKHSLLRHGRPEETYGMALRFYGPKKDVIDFEHMAELLLYFSQRREIGNYSTSIINNNKGDITFLQTILPLIETKYISYLKEWPEFCPLSRSLIEKYV